MSISRRQFLGGGLLLATAPFVLKVQLPNFFNETTLELFLKKYPSDVNLTNIVEFEAANELGDFKKNLELFLANNPDQSNWNPSILEIIKKDFEVGNIKVVDGWIISETELNIAFLKKLYV